MKMVKMQPNISTRRRNKLNHCLVILSVVLLLSSSAQSSWALAAEENNKHCLNRNDDGTCDKANGSQRQEPPPKRENDVNSKTSYNYEVEDFEEDYGYEAAESDEEEYEYYDDYDYELVDEEEYEAYVWTEGTRNEIEEWLECNMVNPPFGTSSELPDSKTWKLLRTTYKKIMEDREEGVQATIPPNFFIGEGNEHGYVVPVKVQLTEDFGRGIFADDFIAKGSLVWTSSKQNAGEFHSASLYRKFLRSLSPSIACDAMHWSYTVEQPSAPMAGGDDDDKKGDNAQNNHQSSVSHMVCFDFDIGSLENDCTFDHEKCNVGIKAGNKKMNSGCDRGDYHALRDIAKGEHILIDYEDFVSEGDGWENLGLA